MNLSTEQELMLSEIEIKTKDKKLKWKEDADSDANSVVLPNGYKVRTRIDAQRTRYVLIYNSEGREIMQFRETLAETATLVFRVWKAAKDSALGVDEALSGIITELKKL